MIPAYNHIYLSKASRAVANMLHNAVLEFGYDGNAFLQFFIQSGVAAQIEDGNPNYIAGKSGMELFRDVIYVTTGEQVQGSVIATYDRSDVYWAGWILVQYQWYSGRSFQDILEVIPYDALLGLYDTLHEADVHKAYEVMDEHFALCESKLKRIRKKRGMTQEMLAERSGVSLNTIRSYEQKTKDINKAQIVTLLDIANVLNCEVTELLG